MLFFLVLCLISLSSQALDKKILLRDIEALTFEDGKFTSSRRSHSHPQLNCVGGSACSWKKNRPVTVQCYNRGFDGIDVQWECKSELKNYVRFGRMEVNCEGYDYADDPYILYGSCMLSYHLDYTKGTKYSKMLKMLEKVRATISTKRLHFAGLFGVPGGILLLLLTAFGIWFFCLRGMNSPRRSSFLTREDSSAFTPESDPPSYDEAVRSQPYPSENTTYRRRRVEPSAPPEYGWDIPTATNTAGNRCTSESSSWMPLAAATGAGLLGGYFLGSRDRSTRVLQRDTFQYNQYQDIQRDHDSSSDGSTTYTATGFANTSRR